MNEVQTDAPRRAAAEAQVLGVMLSRVRVGDTILTGGQDPISRIIQLGSRSPYSHAAIVTDDDQLTEAYDYALTPDEDSEGIFSLAMEEFLARSGLRRVLILRPVDLNHQQLQRLQRVAAYLRHHSPSFPTMGMACLALCGVSGPLLRMLPSDLKHRSIQRQVRLASDGTRRMHCAETVVRIYLAAGVPIRFRSPRLRMHIEHLEEWRRWPDPNALPSERRIASVGHWPEGRGVRSWRDQADQAIRSAVSTLRERGQADDMLDATDLLLPGDFVRAEPFETVADMRRTREGWHEVPVLTPYRPELVAQVPPTPLARRSA